MIRCLLVAVILFSLAVSSEAETYQTWETSIPNQMPVQFKNWLPPGSNGVGANNSEFFVLESPLGHLFGHLDFSAFPSTAFPLKVAFLYLNIRPSAVSRTPNGYTERVPSWTTRIGYLSLDANLGDPIERREIEVRTPDEGRSVAVWSVWPQSTQGREEGLLDAYSVLIEVTGADGKPIVRKILIEAVADGTVRNVGLARTNSDGESFVKPLADVTTVDELPTEEQVFRDVKVLWLDALSLHDSKYPDSFWRKILLGGTLILGHNAEAQELATRLGVAVNQRLGRGGIWSVDQPGKDLSELMKGPEGQYDLALKKGENPFQSTFTLGKDKTRELRRFSIWFLVSFTVFEFIVIVGSLFFLQGYRRVLRWLLIPLAAVVYTVGGFFFVRFAVDFRPEVRTFQEIDSVEGWPESLVNTDVMRLGFADEQASFSAPALAEFGWFPINPDTIPIQSAPANNKTLFSFRQRYGRFANAHIHYWIPSESPCQMTVNRGIVATRFLQGAWLWDGKYWRNLGPMQPGKPVSIDQSRVIIDPKDISGEGGPGELSQPYLNQDFLPDAVRQKCTTRYMRSLANTDVGILLAIDDQPAPDQMVDASTSEIHRQTLLVHQFKLSTIKP